MKELLYQALAEQGALSIPQMLLNFSAACVLCLVLFVSYGVSHSTVVYSRRFAVSLVQMTLVTTMVMCVIGNNIALSLGMVGALSIIRFRTAIKDSRDATYIFWAIGIGICCGVSDYITATIGSAFIFVILLLFGSVRDNERILLIIHMDGSSQEQLKGLMRTLFAGKAKLRVSQSNLDGTEVIYELSDRLLKQCESKNGALVSLLQRQEGVRSISIMRQEDEINQ